MSQNIIEITSCRFPLTRWWLTLLLWALTASLWGGIPARAEPSEPQRGRTIFDYQKELNLTADQIQRMKARLEQLQASARASQSRLTQLNQQYRALEQDPKTALETLEVRLKEIAAVQVEARMEDLRASRDLLGILSPEQRARWREIQAAARTPETAPGSGGPSPPPPSP